MPMTGSRRSGEVAGESVVVVFGGRSDFGFAFVWRVDETKWLSPIAARIRSNPATATM
jgi:hypothetical protein